MDKVSTLTIGCYWSVAAMLLPDILRAFLKDYPQVHIELREGTNDELLVWLPEHHPEFISYIKEAFPEPAGNASS